MSLSAESSPHLNQLFRNSHPPSSPPILPNHRLSSESPSKRVLPNDNEELNPINKRRKHAQGQGRNTRLFSYPVITRIPALPTTKERKEAALKTAKLLDENFGLEPDNTMVSIRQEPPSSQFELYDHVNNDSWELDVLRATGMKSQIAAAYRCFLDGFYQWCGFRPRWDEWVMETQPQQFNRRYKSREKCVREKRGTLEAAHGIDSDALVYLIGDHSLYYENQDAIHEMPLSAVAAALSNMCRRASKGRQRALLLAWQLLTGHADFEAGQGEKRYIGTQGVVSRREVEDDEDEQIAFDESAVFGSAEIAS